MTHHDRLALAFRTGTLEVPPDGQIVVLRAETGGFAGMVPPDRLRLVQTFRPTHDALVAAGHRVETRADGQAAMVVVNVTRSRAETLGAVATGLGLLPAGGRLVIAGAKADGVEAVARAVGAAMPLGGAFVKAHGRVVWLDRPETLPDAVADWARAAAPSRNAEGFTTMPGIFSPEHADPGSRRLADATAGRLAGRVADLGAGWGWLAQEVLTGNPAIAEIELFEAELLAVDAARANVSDPRARFHWSDASRLGARAGPFDAVVSNPPFHHGRAAEPELGAAFIAAAARILKPHGRLYLVANRQLPYEGPLEAAFRRWTRVGEDGGYKLFEAEAPRRV